MSDNIAMTPEARWRHLRENGPRTFVDLTSNDLISDKPAWFDEEKFKLAKEAMANHYIGVAFSSFTGLLLILQLPDGLEPLLVTGNSKDIPSLYKRYLSTILHVNSWYEDDIFNPETKGYKSIRQVRSMHRRVQQLMNERFQVKDKDGNEHKWMTQYDVALTQFAFIGLAMLWPHKSAMISATHEELELVNYYWRVLGWFMGMRDDFNACQFDKYEDIRAFNELIFEHEYREKFASEPCQKGLEMTQSICLAMHYFAPLITFNSLAHWWSDCFSFNGYELQPLTARDRLLYLWTKFSFNKLLKSRGFLNFSNKLQKKRFNARLHRKDKVYEQLKEKYKDCPHLTYYSDRVDYFGKCPVMQKSDPNNNNDNNDNNNNNNEEEVAQTKKMIGPLATVTFKGCPMGYDAQLPVISPDEQTTEKTEITVAA